MKDKKDKRVEIDYITFIEKIKNLEKDIREIIEKKEKEKNSFFTTSASTLQKKSDKIKNKKLGKKALYHIRNSEFEKNAILIHFTGINFNFVESFSLRCDFYDFLKNYKIKIVVSLINCKFNKIWFNNIFLDELFFNNCQINELGFSQIKSLNFLSIQDETKINKLNIGYGSKIKEMLIHNTQNTKKVEIEEVNICKNMETNFSKKENGIEKLNICGAKIKNLTIKENNFKEEIRISKNRSDNSNCEIDNFIFKKNTFEENFKKLRIGNTRFKKFELQDLKNPNKSEINIGEIETDNFKIKNLRNYGRFKLYNLNFKKMRKDEKIEIIKNYSKEKLNLNSNSFGKSEFQNLNFESFKKNKMFLNNFQETSFLDINWNYEIRAKSLKQEKETYRQLKQISVKQNNNIEALNFYQKEYETHFDSFFEIEVKGDNFGYIIIFIVSFIYFFYILGNNFSINHMLIAFISSLIIVLYFKLIEFFHFILFFIKKIIKDSQKIFDFFIFLFLLVVTSIPYVNKKMSKIETYYYVLKNKDNFLTSFRYFMDGIILIFEKGVSNFGTNYLKAFIWLIFLWFIFFSIEFNILEKSSKNIFTLDNLNSFLEKYNIFNLKDIFFSKLIFVILNSIIIYEIVKSFRKYSRRF